MTDFYALRCLNLNHFMLPCKIKSFIRIDDHPMFKLINVRGKESATKKPRVHESEYGDDCVLLCNILFY